MLQYRHIFKKLILLLIAFIGIGSVQKVQAQSYALKTNALSWATLTPTIGAEIKFAPKFTAEANLMYRPWHVLSDNKKVTGIAVQPEIRYWFCQAFYKHFIGAHFNYADYNGGLKEHRYQGYLLGAGISYGYQMILSQKWNLEFTIGAGYARLNHDKYERRSCGAYLGHEKKDYFGLTKVGISIIYLIK